MDGMDGCMDGTGDADQVSTAGVLLDAEGEGAEEAEHRGTGWFVCAHTHTRNEPAGPRLSLSPLAGSAYSNAVSYLCCSMASQDVPRQRRSCWEVWVQQDWRRQRSGVRRQDEHTEYRERVR